MFALASSTLLGKKSSAAARLCDLDKVVFGFLTA
jgi:hypothetical protein